VSARLEQVKLLLRGIRLDSERYQQLYPTRHETLLSLGVTPDSAGMAQVFSWLPAAQKAAANQAWQQLAGSVAACRRFNEKNGELLIRQYAFVRDFLGFEPDFIYRP